MSIAVENLPSYEVISSKPIRDRAAAFDAAKAAQQERRRDLIELEQTREQAEWRDAKAAEAAQAERKPPPKRSHAAAHDRKTDDARHQLKVAKLAVDRAERGLIAALDRDGPAWIEEVETACSALAEQWATEIAEVTALYARLREAFAVHRAVIGGKQPSVGAIAFEVGQVQGREWASHQPSSIRPHISTGDILAGLADLGTPEPQRQPVKHPPPRKGQGDPRLRGRADVEAEIAEQRAVGAKVEARRAKLLAQQDRDD